MVDVAGIAYDEFAVPAASPLRAKLAWTSIVCVNSIRQIAQRIVTDEYLDLYILSGAALAFTILGALGISGLEVLSSVILALLTVLALSQIRSRRLLLSITKSQQAYPLAIFRKKFPEDLGSVRASASSLTLIGVSMARVVEAAFREELVPMLASGGKFRVLLIDPENEELLRAAGRLRPQEQTPKQLRQRIQNTLEKLDELQRITGRRVEVRVASFIPSMEMTILNEGDKNGLIVMQHHEFKALGEDEPIIQLKADDDYWYNHFIAEAKRMWEDGKPWRWTANQIID